MKKNEYDKEKFMNWLNEKWFSSKQCPICKHNQWSIGDDLIEFRPFLHGSFVVGGTVYPAALIICNNCGHTIFFNAIVLKLIEKEKGED